MTGDEIHRILEVAPEKRRLLYEVAFCAGLRAGELCRLTVGDLNSDLVALNLHPEITKNRKPGWQPIPRAIFERLQESAQGKNLDDPLLSVPSHPAREMDKDLETAAIPKRTREGKIDFHAVRVAYVSHILKIGADPKEAQALARHSTLKLTMETYARASYNRLSELAAAMGKFIISPGISTTVSTTEKGVGSNPIEIPGNFPSVEVVSNPTSSALKNAGKLERWEAGKPERLGNQESQARK